MIGDIQRAISNFSGDPYTMDVVCLGVEAVVTQFGQDVEQDQDAAGHAQGQAENIDEGKGFLAFYGPVRDFEMVAEHVGLPTEEVFQAGDQKTEEL